MGHSWTRLNISKKKPLDCFDGTVFALSLKKKPSETDELHNVKQTKKDQYVIELLPQWHM